MKAVAAFPAGRTVRLVERPAPEIVAAHDLGDPLGGQRVHVVRIQLVDPVQPGLGLTEATDGLHAERRAEHVIAFPEAGQGAQHGESVIGQRHEVR